MIISNKRALASELAKQVHDWSLGSLLSFATENYTKPSAPAGNVYTWTPNQLLNFCYDEFANELERMADDDLVMLNSLYFKNKKPAGVSDE